jgi:hypothetical protein
LFVISLCLVRPAENIRGSEHWETIADGPLAEIVVEWESITQRTLQEFGRLLDEERGDGVPY